MRPSAHLAPFRFHVRNIGDRPARDVRVTTTLGSTLRAQVAVIGSGTCDVGRQNVVCRLGGDDRIYTADGEQGVIACGSGNDTIQADKRDRVSTDCEAVERVRVAR